MSKAQARDARAEVTTQLSCGGKGKVKLSDGVVVSLLEQLRARTATHKRERDRKADEDQLNAIEEELPQQIKDLLAKNRAEQAKLKADLTEDIAASEARSNAKHAETANVQEKLAKVQDQQGKIQDAHAEEIQEIRDDRDRDLEAASSRDAHMIGFLEGIESENNDLKKRATKLEKRCGDQQGPPTKRARKDKEPETSETLDKKKLQKELDTARRNVTKATAAMEQDREAEDILKQGCDAGRSAKPALTAAKKKREKSEDKLARAEKELATLEAEFELKFPTCA